MYMICVVFTQPKVVAKAETLVRINFINKHYSKAVIISYIINYNLFRRLLKSGDLTFRASIQGCTNR
jgi:hypothetical protein